MTDLDAALADLPTTAPVPPALDAAVLARIGRPRRSPWPILAAAVLLLGLGGLLGRALPHAEPTLVLTAGVQDVTGHARVLAGPHVVEIDGRARIEVSPPAMEPQPGLAREEGQEVITMPNHTHLAAAVVGALVTVTVYEGRALVTPDDGAPPVAVVAGETRTLGPAKAPARAPVEPPRHDAPVAAAPRPEDTARIAELEGQLQRLQARQAITSGQLAAVQGEPQPWPDDVAAAWRPAAFERSLRALAAEEEAGDLLTVDCSEFPCLAVLEPPPFDGPGVPPSVQALVERMGEALGGAAVSVSNARTNDDGVETSLVGLGFLPPDRDDPDLDARSNWRMEGHLKGLADERRGDLDSMDVDEER